MRYTVAGIRFNGTEWEEVPNLGQSDTAGGVLALVREALNNGYTYIFVYDSTEGTFEQVVM
jgi:hypothetical protein